MRIATKLILGATLLALVPLLTSNLLVGNTAIDTSHKALEHASEERLKGIRDTTKARLTDYLDNLKNLMHTLSANPTIAQAAMNLSEAFRDHAAQTGGLAKTDEYRNNVQHFFSTTFQNQYNTLNANANAPVDQWVSQMSDKALEFQSLFIANNPNPLGSKHQLTDINDYSTYEQFHEITHPVMVDYLETFGFYDIFIVEPA